MEREAFEFFKKEKSDDKIVGSGSYLCQILLLAAKNNEANELLKELKQYPVITLFTKVRLNFTEIKVKMALQNVKIGYIEEVAQDINFLLTLQDSLAFLNYDSEVPRKLAELEAERAKMDKKQQELENQLTKEELEKAELKTWASIIIAFLSISILGVIIYTRNQRAKRKQAELEVRNQAEQRKVIELEVQNQSEQRKVAELEVQNQSEQKKVIELELTNQRAKQKESELQSKNKEIAYNLEKTKTEMKTRIVEERNQVVTKAFGDMAYHIHNEAGGTLTLTINELTALSDREENQKALQQLKELKEKFRDISRIFQNIEQITTLEFSLQNYTQLIAKNNPTIFFEYDTELPQLVTEVKGNRARDIHFIIQEFVENSIKYAEASKITVFIEIDSEETRDNLLIIVTDDGKGFDTQATETSGMKMTNKKIEELGGNLIINSSKKGTRIEIRLPFIKQENQETPKIDLDSI